MSAFSRASLAEDASARVKAAFDHALWRVQESIRADISSSAGYAVRSATVTPDIEIGAATPIADNLKIIIDSPDSNTVINSPLQVSGTASVDKGTVVAVVLDAAGTELGRGTATASAAKPDFGHFDLTVSFSGATPGPKGRIKVFGVSPRAGTTPTTWYYIDVSFA